LKPEKIVEYLNEFSNEYRYGYLPDGKICKVSIIGEKQEAEAISQEKAFNELKELIKQTHQKLGEATLDMIEEKSASKPNCDTK
jgi:predicted DNA-binding antitoxin AbrB/MazE fold protein